MTASPQPARGTRPGLPVPPRALAAASLAVGAAQIVFVFGALVPFEAGDVPVGFRLRAAIVAVVFNLGYLLAPFLIGRGDWRTFAAGLLLVLSLYGWLASFVPGAFALWSTALLAGLGAAILAALFVLAVWALVRSFLLGRAGGSRPGPSR